MSSLNLNDSTENLDANELFELFKKNKKEIARCNVEISWITKFLQENGPHFLENAPKYLLRAHQEEIANLQTPNVSRRSSKPSRVSSKYHFSSGVGSKATSSLQTAQSYANNYMVDIRTKCDFCEKLSIQIEDEIEKNEIINKNRVERLEAQIEGLELTEKDYKMLMEEFDSFVIDKEMDPKTNPCENFMKFINQGISTANKLANDMRLQIFTVLSKAKKLEANMQLHKELDGILRPVDFEELEIEETRLKKTQLEKDSYYLGLRERSAQSSLRLETQQKQMSEIIEEHNDLLEIIKKSENTVQKLGLKLVKTENDSQNIQQKILKFEKKSEQYKAPTALEYIEKLEQMKELNKQFKTAERKNRIAKLTLLHIKQKFLKMNQN